MPHELRCSIQALFLVPCEHLALFTLLLVHGFSLVSGDFPTHTRWLVLCRYSVALSSIFLPSSLLCSFPATFAITDSPSYFNSGRPSGVCLHPLPCAVAWNSHKAVSRDNRRAHLICFPSLGYHCPSLLGSTVLETTLSYILSSLFIMSGGRVILVSVAPFLPEV